MTDAMTDPTNEADDRRVHAFTDDALGDHDATALAGLLRDGQVRATELVEAAIARADKVQPLLNPVQYADYERARAAAVRLDDEGLGSGLGSKRGELAGVPFFFKDNVDVEGMPTNHGSVAWEAKAAKKDGPVAALVHQLGVVCLGKSRLPEFGFSASTEYMEDEPVRNPWNPAYSAGASSGGSAALVAAGVVPAAHANDGGGSIRIPAAACGLVGLKPTKGRFAAEHLDRILPVPIVSQGVVTRTVRDTALIHAAAERVSPTRGLPAIGHVTAAARRRLRVGVLVDSVLETPTDQETRTEVRRVADALAADGHHVEDVAMPVTPQFAEDFALYWAMLAFLATKTGRVLMARDFDVDLTDGLTKGLAAKFGKEVRHLPGAIRRMRKVPEQYRAMFRTVDVVLSPTLGHITPEIGHLSPTLEFEDLFARLTDYVGFTPLGNVSGGPAISVPTGRTSHGLPLSTMFSAAQGDERTLLELAYELEERHPFPRIQA